MANLDAIREEQIRKVASTMLSEWGYGMISGKEMSNDDHEAVLPYTQAVLQELYDKDKPIAALEEWKTAVLGRVKAFSVYEEGEWGGDKEGRGHVFEVLNYIRKQSGTQATIIAEGEKIVGKRMWFKRDILNRVICVSCGAEVWKGDDGYLWEDRHLRIHKDNCSDYAWLRTVQGE